MPSSSSAADTTSVTIDPTPLINSSNHPTSAHNERHEHDSPRGSFTGAGLLRRAATAVGKTEQQAAVRVAMAEHIEKLLEDWPAFTQFFFWNSLLFVAAAVGLIITRKETVSVPLRMWVAGYMIQCIVRIICVWMQYDRYKRHHKATTFPEHTELSVDDLEEAVAHPEHTPNDLRDYLDMANRTFQVIWWMIAYYWLCYSDVDLVQEAPGLHRLVSCFMILDAAFIIVYGFGLLLVILGLCFLLPYTIAVVALSSNRGGATNEDIGHLPKFTFKTLGEIKDQNDKIQESFGGLLIEHESSTPTRLEVSKEDCECAICGGSYEDGCMLLRLPCNHNFHSSCIQRWLHIKPLCPLCKGRVEL